ncbi:MAG: hypothetical protein M3384_07545 [Acidobacteriota bacterium]|nr:hypothetical protein [Acidobacteriota bacterium]
MKRLKYLFLIPAFLLTAGNSAFGCVCFGPDNPKEALKYWSDVVFLGEVVAVEGAAYTFKVERAWKGVSASEIVIYDAHPGSSCASDPKKGVRYIIFASVTDMVTGKPIRLDERQKAMPFFDICSFSISMANAEKSKRVLKKLGKGRIIQ